MTRLALGVLLWSIVHILPAIVADMKKKMVIRIGEYPYKGVFTLLIVVSIYLIVSGWKSVAADELFNPPEWGGYLCALLVLAGTILFLAPYPTNNFKRILRHPQLIGMALWGVGHLLATGDSRSMLLFGGLTAWSLLEIVLINRRDGAWIKPGKVPHMKDLGLVVFGLLVYLAFLFTHHILFGGEPLI